MPARMIADCIGKVILDDSKKNVVIYKQVGFKSLLVTIDILLQ